MKLTHLEYDADGTVHCTRTFDSTIIPPQPVAPGQTGLFLSGHDYAHDKIVTPQLKAQGGETMMYLVLYDKTGTIHQVMTAVSETHAASLKGGEHFALGCKKLKVSYEDAEKIAFNPALWLVDDIDAVNPVILAR